ncbi:hypothetical protein [Vandammella animalimorsus]|uniref:hypothetical protein n=1 Tax=Vandammella animalimorsus TaxID=2029117 RepID=UPI0011789450|nr:hypothetical protein [Vandammella animalimorsus]
MQSTKTTAAQWRRRALRAEAELERVKQVQQNADRITALICKQDAARFVALREIRLILDELATIE